jgi:histone deacetylase 1/2
LDNDEFLHWRKDIDFELNFLQKNNTWTLIELPKDRKPITCKWVFKIRYSVDGGVKKYIWACFVAWGFNQVFSIDFGEKNHVL